MAEAEAELTVAERLGRLLDRGLLPAGGPAEAAERLIERLQRPARVALLGLPGSGKSAILNLLAGTVVVPEALRLPTIIVQYGAEPRMLCTVADGHTEVIHGTDLEKSLALSPALITLELDLPALRVISLLEVAAGPLEAEQRRAALWAGKRADILIWCTTSYLPKEQMVWEGMPDAFKDNGFLLLTKVDLLGGRDAAAGMHHRVSQRATGEFRQVLSISAKEARAATPENGAVDRDRFRESGASAVIAIIKSRVQMAIRADTDTAELILARHGATLESPPRPIAEPTPEPTAPVTRETEESLAAEAAALERIAAAAAAAAAQPVAVSAPTPPAISTSAIEAEAENSPQQQTPIEGDLEFEVRPEATAKTELPTVLEDGPSVAFPEASQATQAPEIAVTGQSVSVLAEPDQELSESESAAEAGSNADVRSDTSAEAEPDFLVAADSLPEESEANKGPEPVGTEFGSTGDSGRTPAEDDEAESEEAASKAEDEPQAETIAADSDATESDTSEAEADSASEERSARFTARLKQIPQSSEASKPGLIPLRATWKSRTDATDSMPIEPKPTPNTKLTPRARPTDPSGAARLVGKLPRAGDGSGEFGGHPGGKTAGASATDPNAGPSGAGEKPRLTTEPETRSTKITSVFGARSRSAPADVRSDEASTDDLFPPLPNTLQEAAPDQDELATTAAAAAPEFQLEEGQREEDQVAVETALDSQSDFATESSAEEPPLDAAAEPPEAAAATQNPEPDDVQQPDETEPLVFEPDAPAAPIPEPESPRPSLSDRLGVRADGPGPVRRDIPGAVRVSRPVGSPPSERFSARPAPHRPADAASMTSPQDLVAPRVSVLRDKRGEGVSSDRRERPRIAPIATPTAVAPPNVLQELPAAEKLYLEQAVNLIVARSAELADQIDPNEKLPVDLVLQHGLETTEQVMATLSRGGTAQLRRITASLGEIQDLILLMQLEKGHAPADDTLTLLLQLKREMETLRAV